MHMNTYTYLLALISIALFSSCSPSLNYYTDRIHQDMSLNESELQKVQFYLSETIVLYRELGSSQSKIANGKIKLVNGKKVEEIVFPRETPGVVLFSPKSNRLAVSFEEGDDAYLMFGPKPKDGGKYVLLAKDWGKRSGKVTYKGETWHTSNASAFACLLVDIDKARNISKKTERVSGRRI